MSKAIKVFLVVLAVTVTGWLVAAQRVEVNRHYEFGPFYAVSTSTNLMTFALPQELKAVVVTFCSIQATQAIDVARSPLETSYKGIYRGTTNTVDLWYPSGLLTGNAGTNTLFVPDIKAGLLIKGGTQAAAWTISGFRVIIDAITLQ